MPTNMMVPLMGRHETNDFALDDIYRRQMLAQQLAAAGSQPQAYGPGIGPGLSSLGQGIGAALQRVKAQHLVQQYNQAHTAGMQLLANTLMNGGNMAGIVSQLPPELQGEALNTIAQNMQLQRQMQMQQAERQFELNKIDYANKSKANYNPQLQNQMRYNQVQDTIGQVQGALAHEQDPNKRQVLQDTLNNLNATSDSYIQRLRNENGQVPDLRKEFTNQALQSMQQGQAPSQAQMYALGTYGMPGSESAYQKGIGEVTSKMAGGRITDLMNEAKAVQDLTTQGNEVLAMMAANPNVEGGYGRAGLTKAQTFLSQLLPGLDIDLGDQQAFQKAIGQMTLKGVGALRGQGVQRITESEIENVIPMFTPTIQNSREGLQKIIELNNAINPAVQKGASALNMLIDQYNRNPRGVDLQSAINDLYTATQQEAQDATMKYLNAELAPQGKQVTVNPAYDPVNNPINKYITTPTQNSGPGNGPAAGAPLAPAANAPQSPINPNALPGGSTAPSGGALAPVGPPGMPPVNAGSMPPGLGGAQLPNNPAPMPTNALPPGNPGMPGNGPVNLPPPQQMPMNNMNGGSPFSPSQLPPLGAYMPIGNPMMGYPYMQNNASFNNNNNNQDDEEDK